MDEFVFHIKEGKPRKVTKLEVQEYLEKQHKVLRTSTHIPKVETILSGSLRVAFEKSKSKMTEAISEELTKRMEYTTFQAPLGETVIQGEIIVLNIHQLMDMLKDFGADVI